MKKVIINCITLLFISTILLGQGVNDREFLVKISNLSSKSLSNLILLKFDISDVINDHTAYGYVTQKGLRDLRAKGFKVEVIPDHSRQYADSLWLATQNSANPLDEYHSFEELTATMLQFQQDYPDLCLVESVGKSALGRDLWVAKISDNVQSEEPEPEFKYISSMHGDEPVGMEMCLKFIRHLLENYNSDSRIKQIVDETEIWIMPLMNPDGYVLRKRYNYNNVDLNRNFPDRISDPNNTPEGRQLETQAVMNFCNHHSFVLSANFHTGALVVNYPYDSNESGSQTYTACPDDQLFIEISKAYSFYNQDMWNSYRFQFGITNGTAWYPIYGGMQDWNYVWMKCNEVTVEVSNTKWPNASLLPSLWEDNRESMLHYLETINWGVRGIVTDSTTHDPLFATIEVLGIDHKIYSDPDLGDYYRMLLPGEYTLRFSADGYYSKEFYSVQVVEDHPTYLYVQLAPFSYALIEGTVTDKATQYPIPAKLEFIGDSTFVTQTDSGNGNFQIDLPLGKYQVIVSNDRYAPLTDSLTVTGNLTVNFQLQPYLFVYESDFESDNGGLIPSDSIWQWGKPEFGPESALSGQNVWGTALTEKYPDNANSSLVTPEMQLPNSDWLKFSFKHWIEAETDLFFTDKAYDGGVVEISINGSNDWIQLFPENNYPFSIADQINSGPFAAGTSVFSGQSDWKEELFDLTSYKGQTVQLRFHFGSDDGNEYPFAGWYIDDVAVKYLSAATEVFLSEKKQSRNSFYLLNNYPNPFNNRTTIYYSIPDRSKIQITVYNIMGQAVKTLINKELPAGSYQMLWDGSDDLGKILSSGVYIIQLRSAEKFLSHKTILLQ